ncbi:hypothetical protein FACS189421_13330 [Bacteroidia bacterium]|nr:hypothetical protein FACS189421_13330 [Bacteroidia bacterium]
MVVFHFAYFPIEDNGFFELQHRRFQYTLQLRQTEKYDFFTLTYQGNQLKNVSDYGAAAVTNPYDFKDYPGQTVEYEYNKNGAMTKDRNKGITSIRYNHLNLPVELTVSNPLAEATNEYTYTATGAKLKVIHRWTPSSPATPVSRTTAKLSPTTNTTTTDYAGNKIYENGVLSKILTENGYYEGGKYYFYIRDHLGNNRLVMDENANIVQSTEYYLGSA